MVGTSRTRAPGGAVDRARLRLLIVAPSLDILGGQAVQADRLLSRLRGEPSLSVDFLPVNPRLPGRWRGLQRVKYLRTLVTFPTYVVQVLLAVRRFDVVHIFSASYLSFVLAPTPALLAARLWRRRSILNYRSGEAGDHLARWRRTAVPTVRMADAVVVPSGYLVDVFGRFRVRAHAIPNFVDLEEFAFRERGPLAPVFLSNRNLEPLYDVGCIIDAFALIQAEIPDARLVVAGDGSQRAALEERARGAGLRGVSFLGKVDPRGMSRLYREADIYLNSSVIDNMPTSIIEAFACGLPVVTSDAGGIPYFVEHGRTGLMVGQRDPAAMAREALRLLRTPDLAAALIANARRECERYRWSSVRQQWLAVYHEGGADV